MDVAVDSRIRVPEAHFSSVWLFTAGPKISRLELPSAWPGFSPSFPPLPSLPSLCLLSLLPSPHQDRTPSEGQWVSSPSELSQLVMCPIVSGSLQTVGKGSQSVHGVIAIQTSQSDLVLLRLIIKNIFQLIRTDFSLFKMGKEHDWES